MRPRTVKLAARRVALVAACWMALLLAPALLGGQGGARVVQANHVCGHAQAPACTATPAPATVTSAPATATARAAASLTPTPGPTVLVTPSVTTATPGVATSTATPGLATSTATSTSAITPSPAAPPTETPRGQGGQGGPPATNTPPSTSTPLSTAAPALTPSVTPSATATPVPSGARVLTVSGGAPGSFSAALAGTEQQVFTTLEAYTVTDGTSRADGWNVTVQAAAFTCAPGVGACPAQGDSLPAGSLFMAPPVVSCADANRCAGRSAPPVVALAGPVAIDVPTAVRIASAAVGTGDGTYVFTPAALDGVQGHHLRLTLPASAYATNYGSTLTFTVAVGP